MYMYALTAFARETEHACNSYMSFISFCFHFIDSMNKILEMISPRLGSSYIIESGFFKDRAKNVMACDIKGRITFSHFQTDTGYSSFVFLEIFVAFV